jgi:hypothetical protein
MPSKPVEGRQKVPFNPWLEDTLDGYEADLDDQMEEPEAVPADGQMEPAKKKKKSTLLELEIQSISSSIDQQLALAQIDPKKLQDLVYKIIQALGRKMAGDDQQYISDMQIQIEVLAVQVQQTYNNWKGTTITVISAIVSVAGGLGGLSPLLPISVIGEEAAKTLAGASQSLGSAGTSLSGLSKPFYDSEEGKRSILQIHLKRKEAKEEDKKNTKHGHKEMTKDASKSAEAVDQAYHQTFTEVAK